MNDLSVKGCASSSPSHMTLNPDEFRHHLEDLNISVEEENELLQSLWHIMSMMVDLGWGVDNINIMLPELFNRESEDDRNDIDQLSRKEVPND